jgi:hypothetical protein
VPVKFGACAAECLALRLISLRCGVEPLQVGGAAGKGGAFLRVFSILERLSDRPKKTTTNIFDKLCCARVKSEGEHE